MDRPKDRSSALEHSLLDAISDASGSAIFVVDGDDLILYVSPQLLVFCDIPDFYIQPGTRLRDFLGAVYDHCLRSGNSHLSVSRETWIADRVAAHWRERLDVCDYISRKRVMRSVVRRLPSGLGICVLTDVTEQKKREENWRVDLERIKATESILDSLPQPLVVMDEQFKIAATNKAFVAMVDHREDLLADLPASAVFDAAFVAKLKIAAAKVQDKGGFIAISASEQSEAGPDDQAVAYIHMVGNVGRAFFVVSFSTVTTPPAKHVLRSHHTSIEKVRSAVEQVGSAKASASARRGSIVPDTIVIVTNDQGFEALALQVLASHKTDHCVVRNRAELQAFFNLVESIDIRIDLTVIDTAMPASLADFAGQKARSVVMIDRQHVADTLEQRLKTTVKHAACSPQSNDAPPQERAPQEALEILVVEDNEVNQIVFSQILDGLGCTYHVAANAADGLSIWQNEKPSMVLMDISLPDMNGMDVCRLMRREELSTHTHSVIVGVLVPAFDHDRPRCLEAGMDDVIIKPLSPDMIAQLLARHLGERWAKPARSTLQ
ncbi:response regulator [Rhizobium sp.]|jgi:CheY-like chemotaxis protein/PAS domain-containing protein|uniref:response regulator n=1 Tax=Rhizobium sp. TaxID=391 RepID=UPI000E8881EE|nr:hypothetical protein [Rhizobium sp.]